jgi:hypothetical protein
MTPEGDEPVSADWYGRLPDCATWTLAGRATVVKVIDPPPDFAYRLVSDRGPSAGGITADVRTFRRSHVQMISRRPATWHDRWAYQAGFDRGDEWHIDKTGVLVSTFYEPDFDRMTEVVRIPFWTACP